MDYLEGVRHVPYINAVWDRRLLLQLPVFQRMFLSSGPIRKICRFQVLPLILNWA